METIKNALGYGTTEPQSGGEPVSGQTGAGEAGEPYDAGNSDESTGLGGEAPQSAAAENTSSILDESGREPVSGHSGSATADEPHVAGSTQESTGIGGEASRDVVTETTSSAAVPESVSSAPEESGREPVSGQTGSGTVDEPYDAGNTGNTNLGGDAARDTASKGTDPISEPVTGAESSKTPDPADNITAPRTESTVAPNAIKAEDFPTVTDPSKAAKRDFDHDTDKTTGAGGSAPSAAAESSSSLDKPLPSTPGQSDDVDEVDESGKKKLSTKLKEKLHIGKH